MNKYGASIELSEIHTDRKICALRGDRPKNDKAINRLKKTAKRVARRAERHEEPFLIHALIIEAFYGTEPKSITEILEEREDALLASMLMEGEL